MKFNLYKHIPFLVFFAFSFISCDSIIVTPVPGVCDGDKIESAQTYNPSEKIHKIILYEGNSVHSWQSDLPNECQGTVTDFELVGCIKTTDDYELNTCNYSNGHKRTQKTQLITITLLVAKTGQQIGTNDFYGEVKDCPDKIYNDVDEDIIGNDVEYDQVKDWLLGYLSHN